MPEMEGSEVRHLKKLKNIDSRGVVAIVMGRGGGNRGHTLPPSKFSPCKTPYDRCPSLIMAHDMPADVNTGAASPSALTTISPAVSDVRCLMNSRPLVAASRPDNPIYGKC